MDETNFASLSPTLLARKGGAKPAMRPQIAPLTAGNAAQSLEDLGWNDMGEEDDASKNDAEVVHLTPAPANPDTAAEAQELDQQSEFALAKLPAEKPEIHRQQEELSQQVEASNSPQVESGVAEEPQVQPAAGPLLANKKPSVEPAVLTSHKRRSALARGKRAAFTLRLDADRHLKLRLACTLRGRSAQQLVTDALDILLDDMSDVDSLAAQVRGQN